MTVTGSKTSLNGHGPVSGHPDGRLKSPTGEKVEPETLRQSIHLVKTIGQLLHLSGEDTRTIVTPGLVKTLGQSFYLVKTLGQLLGKLVALHPWKTIGICLLVVGLVGIGFMRFSETTDSDKLWVPEDADVLVYKSWVDAKFPGRTRLVNMIFEADNVLTASVVKTTSEVNTVYKNSLALVTGTKTLSDVCIKAGNYCRVTSILELWSYNDTAISSLTDADVLNEANLAANTTNYTSPMYLNDYDIATQVGGRTYASDGTTLQSAKALKITYLLQGTDAVQRGRFESLGETCNRSCTESFSDVAGETISGDIRYLTAGYFLLIVFVAVILGRFNCTEHRIGLAFCGILVIGLSICLSFSLASAAGWEYGLYAVLYFILHITYLFLICQSDTL
ncbi:hypothetical protein KUTeg_016851 [Tegillarca granosa]|uniref:Uncharacterized protein n=1 Tax=Tegillarca granosa TaxID=220873 RepID=A0ABQ9EM49_TEGGR|nr:hypothetical protein KUTeg_016851 [Tegillarca granosa]